MGGSSSTTPGISRTSGVHRLYAAIDHERAHIGGFIRGEFGCPRAGCPTDQLHDRQRVVDLLSPSATAWERHEHTRRLTAMRRLVFALVLLVVIAACARQPQPDQSIPAEISGEWELVRGSIGGAAIPTPEGARVTLQIKDTELKGRAFCNIYHAQYRLTRGRLILDGLVSSEMGCESALMAAERTYLEALAVADGVPRTDSDELVLVGEGVELQFTRADSTLP